jgi:hypothetical protein
MIAVRGINANVRFIEEVLGYVIKAKTALAGRQR